MPISLHLAAVFFLVAAGGSAYLWSSRLPLPGERTVRALAGLVLWELFQLVPVQILGALQIAGLIGKVTVFAMAGLQGMILVVSVAWAVTHPSNRTPDASGTPTRWPTYLLCTAAMLACSYGVFALDLFTSYPSGDDALAYHLPLALRWLQTGSLALPVSRAWRFSMPGNTEIGMMMLLATGSQASVALVNWTALAVLVISTYLLARRISDGNRLTSATVVLLLLSVPMVEFQTFSAYVDLSGTAFLMAAFALFLYRKQIGESETTGAPRTIGSPLVVFLSAAACGISLGTKPVYDLYGAAYAAFVLYFLWKYPGERRAFPTTTALLVAGLLLPSAFWFGRALQAAHNPVFPMRVAVAGHIIFPGYAASDITDPNFDRNFVHSRSEWLIYPWTEWKRDPGYLMISYGEGSGLGAAFASLVPVGIAFLLYLCVRGAGSRIDLFLLIVLATFSLAWWFALHRLPRFGLPIVVLACVLAVPLIAALQSERERGFRWLLISSVAATCMISTFVPIHALLGRLRTHHSTRAQFYEYPPLLEKLPSDVCVLNKTKSEEKNFALAGQALQGCVVPGFEAPPTLTPQFFRENNVGYVAEIVPEDGVGSDLQALPQLSLLRDEFVPSGERRVRWRIWKVGPGAPGAP